MCVCVYVILCLFDVRFVISLQLINWTKTKPNRNDTTQKKKKKKRTKTKWIEMNKCDFRKKSRNKMLRKLIECFLKQIALLRRCTFCNACTYVGVINLLLTPDRQGTLNVVFNLIFIEIKRWNKTRTLAFSIIMVQATISDGTKLCIYWRKQYSLMYAKCFELIQIEWNKSKKEIEIVVNNFSQNQ